MADVPPKPGGTVSPKKETVRISLPPKPSAKETVRLTLPPKPVAGAAAPAAAPAGAPAAKQTVRLQLPPKPGGAAPAPAPVAAGAPAAKQTVRLQLPPKPAAGAAPAAAAGGAKQTVRLQMPPKPAAGGGSAKQTVRLNLPPKGGTPGGARPGGPPGAGKELKAVVPQTDPGAAASAEIPDHDEAEMPTMDSSAPPAKPAAPGPRSGPPGGRPPAAASTDSTPSAVSLPAKKAPKPKLGGAKPGAMAPAKAGSSVGVVDILLGVLAMGAGIAAGVMVFLLNKL